MVMRPVALRALENGPPGLPGQMSDAPRAHLPAAWGPPAPEARLGGGVRPQSPLFARRRDGTILAFWRAKAGARGRRDTGSNARAVRGTSPIKRSISSCGEYRRAVVAVAPWPLEAQLEAAILELGEAIAGDGRASQVARDALEPAAVLGGDPVAAWRL
jgi:hypothetical protein